MGYTHTITFYKKVPTLGWMFSDFRTTADALQKHVRSLYKMQAAGTVRMIDVIKLRDTPGGGSAN